MALLVKEGFGQLEPNHLSAQRNGQLYAQLPCEASIEVLQNAQFAKHSYKDFALQKKNFVDGVMVPRVMKTMPGDIFTTNLVELGAKDGALVAGDKLVVGTNGILEYSASPAEGMIWQVAKVYTMADGQPAVKIQRIA